MANELTTLPTAVNEPANDTTAEGEVLPGYVPEGYKDAEEFLSMVRKEFAADEGYDRENRNMALEDLKFIAGEQWDPAVKASREAKGRPVLTINVLPQYVGQVMGDRRLNKTSIKVRPIKEGTTDIAEARSGIIKGIEAASRAERVYDAACEAQVSCGISNFRIDMDYAGNDVFEQDINIRHIPNPLAVVWDRMSVDPTGRDARHCFVQDIMPRDIYDKRFPECPAPSVLGDDNGHMVSAGWFDQDVVRLTEFWEIIEKPATFALMADGDVKDVTGKQIEEYFDQLWRGPTGETRTRKSFRTYARMHMVTGFAILTKAYELPITRLPIIKVEGRVIAVGDDRVRYGLVRYAKDSQRLKNYWRSKAAEAIALAPLAQWISPDDAIEGREEDFRGAHLTGDTLLVYNKNASGKPERVEPVPIPAALLNEAQMNTQDIKDTTGLHDASLGMRSNEISGRAIQARQREGDVATIIYHDNLNASIQEGGDVINQLIPLAYDTMRTLRVIGPDDKHKALTVNDPNDEDSPDITKGKYDVSLETGPSFTTQRQEAADAMMAIVQTAPQLMAVAGDLIVKHQDWPGAQEIAERLKRSMPPELTAEEGEEHQPTEEEVQQAQIQEQMQHAQLQDAAEQLEHASKMRKFELEKSEAEAATAVAQTGIAQANVLAAEAAADKAEADADAAEANAQRARIEAKMAPIEKRHKMALAERTASAKPPVQQRGADGGRKTPRKGSPK